jgi:hypothetical protein
MLTSMTRLLAISLLAGACTQSVVVVKVLAGDVQIPDDVDQLSLRVTNPLDDPSGKNPIYSAPLLPLCASAKSGCYTLPVSTTLFAGKRADELVRVEVEASHQSTSVTRDAATFTFTPGVTADLEFVLYRNCLNVDCAAANRTCNARGDCVEMHPRLPNQPADLGSHGMVTRTWVANGQTGINDSILVPRPENVQPDDFLILQIVAGSSQPATTPPDWRYLGLANSVPDTRWQYHLAGAAEPDYYDFGSNISGATASWALVGYRNVRSIDSSQTIVLQPQPSATITTLQPNALELFFLVAPLGTCVINPPLSSGPLGADYLELLENFVPEPAVTGPWTLSGCDIELGALAVVLAP